MNVCWFRYTCLLCPWEVQGNLSLNFLCSLAAAKNIKTNKKKSPRASSLGTSWSVSLAVSLGRLWENVISAERFYVVFASTHCFLDQFLLQVYGLDMCFTNGRILCFRVRINRGWRQTVLFLPKPCST